MIHIPVIFNENLMGWPVFFIDRLHTLDIVIARTRPRPALFTNGILLIFHLPFGDLLTFDRLGVTGPH